MLGFKDILGHEKIKEHLYNAINTGKVSHAYIITGEAGMGRKSLAHAFALTLLCEKGGKEPCMKCHACVQALSNNHPDLIHVTHEKPGSIGVDDIREQIQDTIVVRPYSSYYKIYMIDEAEKMTIQAQNALLKTIEEPPSYGIIILITTNQDVFLPTILSRCVQLKLKPLKDSVVKEYLMDTLHVEEQQADIYAAFARGNLGRAIHIASSEEFQDMYKRMLFLMTHLKSMDISELLEYIKKLIDEDMDIYECLDFMELWYRDILMHKVTRDMNLMIFKNEYNSINEIGQKCGYDGFENILQAINKARARLEANVNRDLALELMLLVMKEN
ncbi:DNA polymerase III subunit delta' [Lachnospiraceae bacterium 62-35]